jgi:uncharacterized protein
MPLTLKRWRTVILPDVNVLVNAFRPDAKDHQRYRDWLQGQIDTGLVGLPDAVVVGFLRIVTHINIYVPPTPTEEAWDFIEALRRHPHVVVLEPGPAHGTLFRQLCLKHQVKGNLVPDAFLAALAMESGSSLASSDHDFARFQGLRWIQPLEALP